MSIIIEKISLCTSRMDRRSNCLDKTEIAKGEKVND